MEKARYWTAVLYPESMIDDWDNKIADIIQFPVAYCIHDKDKDGHDGDRKTHIHLVIAYSNTTTYKSVLSLVQELSPSCMIVKKVINIRYMFDYLIHDTDSCRKAGKHLYQKSERVLLNNFDIGAYEQRSLDDKRNDAKQLKRYIIKHRIENMLDLDIALDSDPDIDSDQRELFEDAMLAYSGYISNILKGVYYSNLRRNT